MKFVSLCAKLMNFLLFMRKIKENFMVMSILRQLWSFLIKDFLTGILVKTFKDIVLKVVDKTPWTVILERFLTRTLIVCLKWLASLSTNQLWVDTVNDFLAVLYGKGLKEARLIDKTKENSSAEPAQTFK